MERAICPPVRYTVGFPLLGKALRAVCNRDCNQAGGMMGQKPMARRKPPVPGRQRHRSTITSGDKLVPGISEHSAWGRYMRDTFEGMLNHVGGAEAASLPQWLAARHIAAMETELTYQLDKIAKAREAGEEPTLADLQRYTSLLRNLRQWLDAAGWDRTARDITPLREQLLEQMRIDAPQMRTEAPQRAEAEQAS